MTDPVSRPETSTAILEAAARMLAERPDATIGEIAIASGVGRATVYRYFATRGALVDALSSDALTELASGFDVAGRDGATTPQVIQRLVRAFLADSDRYVILTRSAADPAREAEIDRLIGAPFRAVFQRGIEDGTFRRGFDADLLSRSLAGVALAAVHAGLPATIGIDAASDVVASLFLDGARRSKSKQRSKSKSKRPSAE